MQISNTLKNKILFLSVCLMWSFAWIMTKFQVRSGLSVEVCILSRFFNTGIISLLLSLILKQSLKINKKELKILCFYACGCANLYLVMIYYASNFIITAISAIIFSFSIITIATIKYLLKISMENIKIIAISFILGVLGLYCIMLQKLEISNFQNLVTGVSLMLCATLLYSSGAVFYDINKNDIKLSPLPSFFYISIFSVSLSVLLILVKSIFGGFVNFIPKISLPFIISYFYLSFSTFGAMIMMILIRRIGSVKASFVNIVTPVFAILISSVLEDYKIMLSTIIGIFLITISNYIALNYSKIKT